MPTTNTADTNSRIPAPLHPFRHRLPLQIRFNDIDMLGHLNNGAYLEFMDLGKTHYFKAVTQGNIDIRNINAVVANINCDFLAPTYFDEPIEVLTAVTSISNHSFRMEQRIINSTTGQVKCIGHTVMAGFDPHTAQGAEIAPSWVDALTAYEQHPLQKTETKQ